MAAAPPTKQTQPPKQETTLRCCPLLSVSQNRAERQDMNETQKKRLNNLTEIKPETAAERYIFVVNGEQLYKSIWAAQYHAITATAEELITYLDKRINEESYLKDHIFAPCLSRKENESLYTFFDREGIAYSRQGWKLGEIATKESLDKITQANKPKTAEDFPTAYTHKPHSATAYIDTLLSEDIKNCKMQEVERQALSSLINSARDYIAASTYWQLQAAWERLLLLCRSLIIWQRQGMKYYFSVWNNPD